MENAKQHYNNGTIHHGFGRTSHTSIESIKTGNWVTIKPKKIRKIIKEKIIENEKELKTEEPEPLEPIDDERRRTIIEKIKSDVEKIDTPETIDIEKPGKYNIDVKGLLEEEPIVIQKDGSYTIHLPSVFKKIEKKK